MARTKGAGRVGRINADVELANFADVSNAANGLLDPAKVRRLILPGVVDSGAVRLVLPQGVVKKLGLIPGGQMRVRYADGRSAVRDTVAGVYLGLLGRYSTFSAVVEPKRRTALIGAIVLEDLDLLADCNKQRLIPRDPRGAIYEIE